MPSSIFNYNGSSPTINNVRRSTSSYIPDWLRESLNRESKESDGEEKCQENDVDLSSDDDPPLVFDYPNYERYHPEDNPDGLKQEDINKINKTISERNLKNLKLGKQRMFISKEYDKYYNSPTWDNHTNQRAKLLDPKFSMDMIAMINEAFHKYGIKLRIGKNVYRSIQEQDNLFSEGRDPITKKVIKPSEVKTWAPGGASMHNYGWAVDLYEINDNREIKDEFNRKIVLALAFKYGFRWGGYFSGKKSDPPHFERTYGLHWSKIKEKALKQKTKYVDPSK